MSTKREKLKAMYPGSSDAEADSALQFWNEKSAVNRFQRNAHAQRMAIQVMQAYPGLQKAVGKPGDTPAATFFRALSMVADDSKTKEVARLLGGDGSEPRHLVLAEVAKALGVADGQTLDRDFLAPVRNAEMADALTLRRMDGELRDRQAAERAEKLSPPIDARAEERATDAWQRRNLISNLLDDAERAKPPVARAKVSAYQPSTDRQVDLALAWAKTHGEDANLDLESRGVEMWAERHKPETALGQMRLEQRVREDDEIRSDVERQREFARTLEDGLQKTAIGAEARAWAGDEAREEISRIESQFAEEGE